MNIECHDIECTIEHKNKVHKSALRMIVLINCMIQGSIIRSRLALAE